MSATFNVSRILLRRDFESIAAFEEALDDAIREDNPWMLRKTYPDMRQWIVDVLDIDRATSSCAFAYSVELLAPRAVPDAPAEVSQ